MSEPFIGEIRLVGFNFAPRNWAMCDGQLLPIAQNTALFSLLGTTYGGDGRTNFALPDLRGRVPIHPGAGPGLSPRQQGEQGGTEEVTLTTDQMPTHNHPTTTTTKASSKEGDSMNPEGRTWSVDAAHASQTWTSQKPDVDLYPDAVLVTTDNAGGSVGHDNMQPFLGVYFVIALQGIFPSRN